MAKRKAKKRQFGDPVETDGNLYHVEVIKAIKQENGERRYLVQWAGYPGEDTWEPFVTIKQCVRLLTSLWAMLGSDRKPISGPINLPDEWIASEIKYFRATYGDDFEPCTPMAGAAKGKKKRRRRMTTNEM